MVNVHPMAAMTKGLLGEEMTEIGLLSEAGAIAFTNGKTSLANAKVMRNVLAYARDFGALIVHHAGGPLPRHGRRDERGRGRDQARPARHPRRRRDHHARARHPPRRADRRPLSRRPDLLPRLARHHPRRQGARAARHLRRVRSIISRSTRTTSAPTAPSSNCGRRSAPRTTAAPWSRAWRSGDIDVIVSAHDPQRCRRQAPALRRGRRRRHRPRDAARRAPCASITTATSISSPCCRALSTNPAKLLGLAAGRLRQGRARRPRADRPRYALDRRARRSSLALEEHALRRGPLARPGASDLRCRTARLQLR